MKKKVAKRGKKVTYTVKGQIPVYDQYGNVIQQAGLVDVTAEHDVNWFKFWLADMAGVLQVVGGAKMAVFSWLLDNVNRSNNQVGGTMEEIAQGANVSYRTVQETITLLLESNFLKKIRIAQYQINPEIMAYGNSQKRGMLVIQYQNLPDHAAAEQPTQRQEQAEVPSQLQQHTA